MLGYGSLEGELARLKHLVAMANFSFFVFAFDTNNVLLFPVRHENSL